MNNKGIHELSYRPKRIISQHLTVAGDGTGAHSFIGDQTGPVIIKIAPAAGEIFRIARLIVIIEDDSFLPAGYGEIAALGTGIRVAERSGGVEVNLLTDGHNVTTNAGWGHFCFEQRLEDWGKTTDTETLLSQWDFTKLGQFVCLDGDLGQDLAVTLDDDFTGLIDHAFIVQGFQER